MQIQNFGTASSNQSKLVSEPEKMLQITTTSTKNSECMQLIFKILSFGRSMN